MNVRKIVGILLLLLGAASYFLSAYIEDEVALGRQKIAGAEKSVEKGERLSEAVPLAKGFGNSFSKSAHKQIEAGKEKIQEYQALADGLHKGGVIALIVGIGFIALGFARRRS